MNLASFQYVDIKLCSFYCQLIEDDVAQWCNPLTLQPEQSGGMGSIPGRPTPLECHDSRSRA